MGLARRIGAPLSVWCKVGATVRHQASPAACPGGRHASSTCNGGAYRSRRWLSSAAMEAKGGLKVDGRLVQLIKDDIAPGTGVDPEHFWAAFGQLVIENGAE